MVRDDHGRITVSGRPTSESESVTRGSRATEIETRMVPSSPGGTRFSRDSKGNLLRLWRWKKEREGLEG